MLDSKQALKLLIQNILLMNKKEITATVMAIVAIIAIIIGYLIFNSNKSSQTVEDIGQIVNKGVLPSINGDTNPMKNKPAVNPVDASNPFRSIKTNPFQ